VIRLGIGDVTRPLPAVAVDALHTAADEMADVESFRGYGPEQGYDFLREAIAENDYRSPGG
jgi:LL-diaminopimelate aminotransferase